MISKYAGGQTTFENGDVTGFGGFAEPEKSRRMAKMLKMSAAILAVIVAVAGVGGYLYWRSLKRTPQYSLALIIDAARNDDQAAINELVDTDAAVDDFVPQVTSKAIDLYGRGRKILTQAACAPCWKRVCAKVEMCYDQVDFTAAAAALAEGLAWHISSSKPHSPGISSSPSPF